MTCPHATGRCKSTRRSLHQQGGRPERQAPSRQTALSQDRSAAMHLPDADMRSGREGKCRCHQCHTPRSRSAPFLCCKATSHFDSAVPFKMLPASLRMKESRTWLRRCALVLTMLQTFGEEVRSGSQLRRSHSERLRCRFGPCFRLPCSFLCFLKRHASSTHAPDIDEQQFIHSNQTSTSAHPTLNSVPCLAVSWILCCLTTPAFPASAITGISTSPSGRLPMWATLRSADVPA
jgi:hypothetical protein